MGKADGSHDLFWQLFTFGEHATRWRLTTPPGVADNGGLVVAPTGSQSVLAGFVTSQELAFSPLALTSDSGANWRAGNPLAPLAVAPSALAASAAGRAAALVRAHGSQQVVTSSGSLSSWSPLTTTTRLAQSRVARPCGVRALTAVGVASNGTVLAGASCTRSGVLGLYADIDGAWQAARPSSPSALAGATVTPVRLVSGGAVPEGVFTATRHGVTEVLAGWASTASDAWTFSPALALAPSGSLLASGSGPGTTVFAVVGEGRQTEAEVTAGPGRPWHVLPRLPSGTATVAFEPDGALDALSAHLTTLAIWRLAADGRSWSKVTTVSVSIFFGSSS
jgi:hypothetical protein